MPQIRRDPYRLVGTTLAGKYYLEAYAGSGGMGAVYRAYHADAETKVAVKIFKPDLLVKNPRNAVLFEREVKAARKLNHPHIVKVLDSGTAEDEILFMVMEWLDGQTLEELMTKELLSIERVTKIFKQMCDAVAIAHKNNVIHLDIKPANVFMIEDEQHNDFIKVIDFGMARVISSESGTTVTRFLGTYQYCSPEHFGGKVSSRSDVYSLGATLYYMIAGVIPFGTSYIHAKTHPNLELPPVPSLHNVRPGIPVAIDKVIQKALSKNPEDRQESVGQLFDEVSKALNDPQSVDVPVRSVSLERAGGDSHEHQSKGQEKVELLKSIKRIWISIFTIFQRFRFIVGTLLLLLIVSVLGGVYIFRSKYQQNVNGNIPTSDNNIQKTDDPISSSNQQTSANLTPLPDETAKATPSNPTPQTSPTPFQINTRVRSDNTTNGWTNTGIVVRQGQRIHISASGRVSLGANRISTPAGIPNLPNLYKLMPNEPTGALIAVIGDDNDDFIFIGERNEFVAKRDGVLFLGVNEGNLNDNTGSYDAVIEAEVKR